MSQESGSLGDAMGYADAAVGMVAELLHWDSDDKEARLLVRMALAGAYATGWAEGASKMSDSWRKTCQAAEDGGD